jgi:diaminohydroxyphosphoribosylaminopyrimidine deaminase/5-amino-6-(5-phosphoribosylamino)uracil reductase
LLQPMIKQPMQSKFSFFETELMATLLEKAQEYQGKTHPNPLVAAAIYKDNTIISYGVHKKKGSHHAEVEAILSAKGETHGASLMVTLEPCTHTGATPPCVEAIINAGIKDVIYACDDPNEQVRKQGAQEILEAHGITVRSGLLAEDAINLNQAYMYAKRNKRPYIHLKAGMSLDGKIALASGESCYITNEASRKKVHEIRAGVDAIAIGMGTLVADNPKLTVRYNLLKDQQKAPKIIVIGQQFLDKEYEIFKSGYETILATSNESTIKNQFSDVWCIPDQENPGINWDYFLNKCYENDIYSVLIEGGRNLFSDVLTAGIVNQCSFFIAPKLFGQEDAISVVTLAPVHHLADVLSLTNIKSEQLDDNIYITGFCNE